MTGAAHKREKLLEDVQHLGHLRENQHAVPALSTQHQCMFACIRQQIMPRPDRFALAQQRIERLQLAAIVSAKKKVCNESTVQCFGV
jgi:hypothetical protein